MAQPTTPALADVSGLSLYQIARKIGQLEEALAPRRQALREDQAKLDWLQEHLRERIKAEAPNLLTSYALRDPEGAQPPTAEADRA